jgi:hypothetical protein
VGVVELFGFYCSQCVPNMFPIAPHICPLGTYIGGPILGVYVWSEYLYIGGVSKVLEFLFDGPIKEAYSKRKEKKI